MTKIHSRPPLEKNIQLSIMRHLKQRPASFTVKLAAGPYSLPGLPDVLHVEQGRAFFFEVKRPGNTTTKLQDKVIALIRAAGAVAEVVYSVDEVKEVMGLCIPTNSPP